ncbi:helix-turn-helix domain-containing protein [Nocardia cyriacigeorgica]|uniref:helix-turn-helix domain-containing protein n=1 Tax=Nocardia cyriacigeorgica TaxID=135487 RepID=UPI002458D820|nr:helix-turn-helix domain-containing protein [Nocardia cyriacigeorgica]
MAKLDDVIRARLIQLRKERGWTQAQVAVAARALGLQWTRSTVGAIEAGIQRVDHLLEVASLCAIFGLPVGSLLDGGDNIDLPNGDRAPLSQIRKALAGQYSSVEIKTETYVEQRIGAEDPDELERIGNRIGIDRNLLRHLSEEAFGTRFFLAERDKRAGITADTPPRSAQAKRGHATRGMLAEVQAIIDRDGIDAVMDRQRAAAEQSFRDIDEMMRGGSDA